MSMPFGGTQTWGPLSNSFAIEKKNYSANMNRIFLDRSIKTVIIQQIVTLSKYGHDALDICHP